MIGILVFLWLPSLIGQCEHVETYIVYTFQPRVTATPNSYQVKCKECHKVFYTERFHSNPENKSYLDAINNGEPFIEGEYYTITATVYHTFSTVGVTARCSVDTDNVHVGFDVTFKDEYQEDVDSLNEDDVITFRGKAAPDGKLYWTDCDLISVEKEGN